MSKTTDNTTEASARVLLALNREIGIFALKEFLRNGVDIVALLLPSPSLQDPALGAIPEFCPDLPIFTHEQLDDPLILKAIAMRGPDYLLSIHYPHIFSVVLLSLPKIGSLNLHPSLLPHNRGWHTPSWTILDETPSGVTLHWMTECIDSGPIALQRIVPVKVSDTADLLYARLLGAERELLAELVHLLKKKTVPRLASPPPTKLRKRSDLSKVAKLRLEDTHGTRDLLKLLRALTTNNWREAAWFEVDGIRYFVRIELRSEREISEEMSSDQ